MSDDDIRGFLKHGLGYRIDLEDHDKLRNTSRPFRLKSPFRAPPFIDHRPWRRAGNQVQMGSCVGWGSKNGCEILNWIDTRGGIIKLSAMYSYLTSQREAGLLGKDSGSFGSASLDAMRETGVCTEEKFPYPGRYSTKIPTEATAEGKLHLVKSHSILTSYEECFDWLASGTGVILVCSSWVESFVNNNGVIEKMSGRNMGGHARSWHGYSERKDRSGRNYLIEENSHSEEWGEAGFSEYAPSVVDQIASQTRGNSAELIGLSDLDSEFGEPREVVDYRGLRF